MIYITAQLVHFRKMGVSSINVYRHRPGGCLAPNENPGFAVEKVSEEPGQVVAVNVTVPPGGNAVEAYLDVVANDDLDIEMLDRVIDGFRLALDSVSSHELVRRDESTSTVVRYYFRPSLDRFQTYNQLATAVRRLFTNPSTQSPLTVLIEEVDDNIVFHLDDESTARMRVIHGGDWQAPRVRVSADVRHDFEALHGDITRHLVDVTTGLDAEDVRRLGGVRFVDRQGNERSWPEDE